MDLLDRLLNPAILGVLIPIVAIVTCGAIVIVNRLTRSRERLAMIEQGMHPDLPPAEGGAVQLESSEGLETAPRKILDG